MRLGFDLPLVQLVMLIFVNLRPGGALRWKMEDHCLGRSGSVMWQVSTSKVVAPACVG
jgi:hypothetical protein